MAGEPAEQVTEQERAFWCAHTFRVLPRELWPRARSLGACTLHIGTGIAPFHGVQFHDCEVTLRSGACTTVLALCFGETPGTVFCMLPEEIVFIEPLPPPALPPARLALGFVPRPDLQDDCGIAFSSLETALQLAQGVAEHGAVRLTLAAPAPALLAYLRELHAWQHRIQADTAAASVAAAAAAAAAAASAIAVPAVPASVSTTTGSLPTLRPRGLADERPPPTTSSLSSMSVAHLINGGAGCNGSNNSSNSILQETAITAGTTGTSLASAMATAAMTTTTTTAAATAMGGEDGCGEVLSPVPVMPAAGAAVPWTQGIDSLVRAAFTAATSPQVTPPPQQFSPFTGITPGLRTPELDEEAVAVLQHCALQKRQKSLNSGTTTAAAATMTFLPLPQQQQQQQPIPGFQCGTPVQQLQQPLQQQPLQPQQPQQTVPERKAGRFKIPPEQRHRRAYSQGVHGSGAHGGGGAGCTGGLSSFCGTQDGRGGAEGLHECRWEGCHLTFGVLSVLTTHLQLHTLASADFVCRWEGCPRQGKPFNNHSGLFRHLRYHTGDKPCKCPVDGCGFSSVDNGELNRHIKLVHHG